MWGKILIYAVILSAGASGSRVKRHLVFSKGSRLFFSVNVRDNLFDFSDLFANVLGFKIDWDLPSSAVHEPEKSHMQKRDIYQGIENFLYQHNFNGTSCIRKFLCEASNILPNSDLFLAQLYEVVFATKEVEILRAYNISDINKDCRGILELRSEQSCPFSLSSALYDHASNFKPKLS